MFQYPLPSGWGQPSEDAGSALGRLGRDFCNAGEWVSFSTPQFLYAVSWEEARQESFFLALDAGLQASEGRLSGLRFKHGSRVASVW